ncbi:MAG: YjfB family protein [Lachnospiraceae bacterium]
MDIASMSMTMSQYAVQQSVGIAVANKTMEVQEAEGEQLLKMMENSIPSFGHTLDVMA